MLKEKSQKLMRIAMRERNIYRKMVICKYSLFRLTYISYPVRGVWVGTKETEEQS